MNMKLTNALLGLAILLPASALAETEKTKEGTNTSGYRQLIGEEMMDAYQNKTLEGIYASYVQAMRNNEEPVTFTEFHHDNATTTYEHRGLTKFTTTGIYIVRKDRMCYMYNDPPNVKGKFCFYVFEQDNCYFHFTTDEPLPLKAKDFDKWTSMAYRHEDADTCLPDIT